MAASGYFHFADERWQATAVLPGTAHCRPDRGASHAYEWVHGGSDSASHLDSTSLRVHVNGRRCRPCRAPGMPASGTWRISCSRRSSRPSGVAAHPSRRASPSNPEPLRQVDCPPAAHSSCRWSIPLALILALVAALQQLHWK